MSAAIAINHETAAIDRWIEPAFEPEAVCGRCGHEREFHSAAGRRTCSFVFFPPDVCSNAKPAHFCKCLGWL